MREDRAGRWGTGRPDEESAVGRAWLAPPLIAAGSVLTMIALAAVLDLPIRDPDSRYVGSPLALIGVIASVFLVIDVVPRALRGRAEASSLGASFAGVIRDRWLTKRGAIVLVALLSFYATYLSYRNLKSFLPFAVDADHDTALLDLERTVFFGQDPATFLHDLLGTGVAAHVLSFAYLAFLSFVPISLGIMLIWSSRLRIGLWYVTTLSIVWMLGAASYYAVPSQGPIYAAPQIFNALPETGVHALHEKLALHRAEFVSNPYSTDAVASIAAFASLHIAIVFSAALIAHLARAPRIARIGLWTYLGLTALATIYFGWHYVVDDVAGVLIGAFAVVVGARLVGYDLPALSRPSLARERVGTA